MKNNFKLRKLFLIFFIFSFILISQFLRSAIPEFYGFYYVDKGKLVEFKNPQKKSHHSPVWVINDRKVIIGDRKVKFISYKKQDPDSREIRLNKLLLVKRYIVRRNGDGEVLKVQYLFNKWMISNKSIRLRKKPLINNSDLLYLVPEKPVAPGVYCVIEEEKDKIYVLSVNPQAYDKDKEALDCIQYKWGLMLTEPKYVPYGTKLRAPKKYMKKNQVKKKGDSKTTTQTFEPIEKISRFTAIDINSSSLNVFNSTYETLKEYGFSFLIVKKKKRIIMTEYAEVESSSTNKFIQKLMKMKDEEIKLYFEIKSSGNDSTLKITAEGRIKKYRNSRWQFQGFKPSKSFIKKIKKLALKIKTKAEESE